MLDLMTSLLWEREAHNIHIYNVFSNYFALKRLKQLKLEVLLAVVVLSVTVSERQKVQTA